MRILLLTQFYPPIMGGEERHVRNLGAALAARGHCVNVATQWVPGQPDHEMDGEVGVYRIKGTLQRLGGRVFSENERRHAPPFPDPELLAGFIRLNRKLRPDVVHAHNWLVDSYLPMKLINSVPLVVSLHDYSMICPKKNFVYDDEICTGPSFSKCRPCAAAHYGSVKGIVTMIGQFGSVAVSRWTVNKFIAVSRAVARHNRLAETGVGYEVIPNFVPDNVGDLRPLGEKNACLQQLPNEPFILFVGDLMHLKGVDVLITAYGLLQDAPPLVLIGRRCPDTPTVLPPNVRILDPMPHEAIMHAWSRCLFGVLPSVGPEACATVIMEAMALGKPMIASDIGGMPDLITPGYNGTLIPPGSLKPLTEAMRQWIEHREIVTGMEEAALSRVEQLKASSVVPQIENVYRSVCGELA